MTVSGISGTTSTTGATSTSTATTSSTNALASMTNSDTFLKLLVAQLKYQDPMNPTDSSQFLTQTAQMSEAANMATLMQSQQSVLSEIGTLTATSMIGAQVTATKSDGSTLSGTVKSVSVEATGPVLHLDSGDVALSAVTAVNSVPWTKPPTTGA